MSKPPPAALMLCLARLMRWAMVASGTRKALAICGRGQAADGAQGERELRRRRQRGVAAEDEQRQRVVVLGRLLVARRRREGLVGGHLRGGRVLAPAARVLAAQLVGQPARGDRDEPAPRALRHALCRPLDRRGEQRLLHRVLARVEAPVAAHEHAEDLRRQRAQQVHVVVGRAHISAPAVSMSGRTSSGEKRALGQRRAISAARSGLSQSTMR